MTTCKICNSATHPIFNALVLKKYDVQYYKCPTCSFIQTETPYWLNEAYSSAITAQDIGLLYRNTLTLPLLKSLIKIYFDKEGKFVDYGGGYGILVRMLRDSGFNAFRFDKYCDNLFARGFDKDDADDHPFELVTAFEVFEHLENPLEEVAKMLELGEHIFFSTELQIHSAVKPENWWYIMPETGQHISLYSTKSLKLLAQKLGLNFYTNGKNYHLLTKKKINPLVFRLIMRYKAALILDAILPNTPSRLQADYNKVKD